MSRRHYNNDYGEAWIVAAVLLDGPNTKEDIEHKLANTVRKFGFMLPRMNDKHNDYKLSDWLNELLDDMIDMKWVIKEEGFYKLTEKGIKEAEKCRADIKKSKDMINNLFSIKRASTITMIIHFILALLKLPAAILSGSVGLLNDAIDTTVDAISSLIVYLGIRFNRERLVNIILVILMIITGSFTLIQAIRKIFIPEQLYIDIFAFAAVIISALVCVLLYFYQRYVGAKTSTPTLITQSVDSRNHIIAALGVTGGLIAALLNFVWLDVAVGLIVAILICKSAIELLIDMIKSSSEEELDLSHYRFGIYHKSIVNRYTNWLLQQIDKCDIENKSMLLSQSKEVMTGEGTSVLESFEINNVVNNDWLLKKAVDELFEKELVKEEMTLRITDKGRKYLDKAIGRSEKMKKNTSIMHNIMSIISFFFGVIAFGFWFSVVKYVFGRFGFDPLWKNWVHLICIFGFKINLILLVYFLIGFVTFIYGWIFMWRVSHYNHRGRNRKNKKLRKLITNGYYDKVRHPMYGKMIFIQIGLFTSLCIPLAYILCIIMILIHVINGFYEDKYQLPKYFPKEYIEYKAKVRRMFFLNGEIIALGIITVLNVFALIY